MALQECRECKASVSGKAKRCPQCGAPVKRQWSRLEIAGAVVLGIFFLVIMMRREPPPATPAKVYAPVKKTVSVVEKPAAIGIATTAKNAIGCYIKSSVEDMEKFAHAKDQASFNKYILDGKCVLLNAGVDVTVIEYPEMLSGTPCFAYNGVKMWTSRSGLTNYR